MLAKQKVLYKYYVMMQYVYVFSIYPSVNEFDQLYYIFFS